MSGNDTARSPKDRRSAFIQQWGDELYDLENRTGRWKSRSRKDFVRALLDAYDSRPPEDRS